MKLSEFKLELPHSLIAMHPYDQRDSSRMIVVNRKTKKIEQNNKLLTFLR